MNDRHYYDERMKLKEYGGQYDTLCSLQIAVVDHVTGWVQEMPLSLLYEFREIDEDPVPEGVAVFFDGDEWEAKHGVIHIGTAKTHKAIVRMAWAWEQGLE